MFTEKRKMTFDERVSIFKALGNKTRLEIFEKILAESDKDREEEDKICITDIASMFQYSLPTISTHLEILKKAGLIKTDKIGKKIFVNINIDKTKQISEIYQNLIAVYEENHSTGNHK